LGGGTVVVSGLTVVGGVVGVGVVGVGVVGVGVVGVDVVPVGLFGTVGAPGQPMRASTEGPRLPEP
jgi:hypothetical protein